MGDSQRTGALPDLEMDAHLQRPIVRERLCTLLPRGCVADGGVRWRQREGCYEEGGALCPGGGVDLCGAKHQTCFQTRMYV